jgi:hypothetical protein
MRACAIVVAVTVSAILVNACAAVIALHSRDRGATAIVIAPCLVDVVGAPISIGAVQGSVTFGGSAEM